MESGAIVSIMEIVPINYYQRDVLERNMISDAFKGIFRIAPSKIHFKIRSEKIDISKVLSNIDSCNENEKNPAVLRQIADYKKNIMGLQSSNIMCKRFYVIFEYEGDFEGNRSSDINEIYRSMYETGMGIASIFENSLGNRVITCFNNNNLAGEMFYHLLNPKTSFYEPFSERLSRIQKDRALFNLSVPENNKRSGTDGDFVAPKGIRIENKFVLCDGVYHVFLCLKDNGYPGYVTAGWVNVLSKGEDNIDIDIISKRKNHDITVASLEQMNRLNTVRAKEKVHNREKQKEIIGSIQNVASITDYMRNRDDDLFNVMIIITIRDDSLDGAIQKQNRIRQKLHSMSLYTEKAYMTCGDYFKMTMPFTYMNNALFAKNTRNIVTSSMASLYCFTAYELFDWTGFVMGYNVENRTLVAINNFNTNFYSNPNMLFIGSSGSGKTFLEQILGYRMRMTGVRVIYILPVKGFEYEKGCKNIGGDYWRLMPGGDVCINIMQIRPEAGINRKLLGEDVAIEKTSLLTKKVTSLSVFVQLAMGEDKMTSTELALLNKVIIALYNRYGITDDNESIWADKNNGIVKPMPILQHLADAIEMEPELSRIHVALLPFVEGSCQNMNGQTNVTFDNEFIVIDVDEGNIPEELLPAFLYIATDLAYDLAKMDLTQKVAIFMDEIWKMLVNAFCAQQIKKMVLLIRGYGGCLILATQDIEEFMNGAENFGHTILNNTEIKIFLKLKEQEIKVVSREMDFNPEDKKRLKQFKRGMGMIYSNGDKVIAAFKASEREIELFTTDVNIRQEIRKKKSKKE